MIETTAHHPPIPDRSHDWSARFDWHDGDDEGVPIGWGETEREAVLDLLSQTPEWEGDDGDAMEAVIELAFEAWTARQEQKK